MATEKNDMDALLGGLGRILYRETPLPDQAWCVDDVYEGRPIVVGSWREMTKDHNQHRSWVGVVDGEEHVVVKVFRDDHSAQKARWCCVELPRRGASSVPVCLASGSVEKEGTRAHWVVSAFRRGERVSVLWSGFGRERKASVARAIGEVVGEVQSVVEAPHYGEIHSSLGSTHDTWSSKIASILERCREIFLRTPRSSLRSVALESIERGFGELSYIHPRAKGTLVSRALNLDNILIDESNKGEWTLSWLGFERAGFAPAEFDFAYLFWFDLFQGKDLYIDAFYAGLGLARTMDVRRREKFYRFLTALLVAAHLVEDEDRDCAARDPRWVLCEEVFYAYCKE